uniref:Uncharacterized protein n=1 Tax=Arundo donax TaxID=35708 RepID=A0A0A8ZTB1_ARUDO
MDPASSNPVNMPYRFEAEEHSHRWQPSSVAQYM